MIKTTGNGKYDYLLVGAGLYNAVFAHELMKAGASCLVVEKRNHIGGNIYTDKAEGIIIHKYGAHIFHTDSMEVWDYVNHFTEFNDFINSPIACYHDEIYNLPFNMNTFSRLWGISKPEQAKEIIERQTAAYKDMEPTNLEEQALKMVGHDIYEKLIKGYTEKQWGRECSELPAFIIRRLPVRFTYDNNYFNDSYQGIPVNGYTDLIQKLLDGADILLNNEYTGGADGYKDFAGKMIYTGNLDDLYGRRFGKLAYRSLKFIEEKMEIPDYQGNAVVNYTDRETPYTRIIEHKHFTKFKSPTTIITKEIPEKYTGDSEPYYPVNDKENNELYSRYIELNEDPNIIIGGRLGLYKYLDMDKIVERALSDSARECARKGVYIWHIMINTAQYLMII